MAEGPTPSQTVGPFFGYAMPFEGDSQAVDPTVAGGLRIEGQVFDGQGVPVPDAILEVFSGDQFARSRTDPEGAFGITVLRPAAIAGAPHLDVYLFARGLLRHLLTRVYFPDEERANAEDPVLMSLEPSRRGTLIAIREGSVLRFDVHLQGETETVFFDH